eukprot:6178733-Pleurochrysis_carterae.AAC.1
MPYTAQHACDPSTNPVQHPPPPATQEFGIQARAGSSIEQLPRYRRRRRGDTRLEKAHARRRDDDLLIQAFSEFLDDSSDLRQACTQACGVRARHVSIRATCSLAFGYSRAPGGAAASRAQPRRSGAARLGPRR